MQKVSHFVADFLAEQGLSKVFMLTGGGAMHLNHSFGTHSQFETVFVHHEQSAAMAAESYARLMGDIPIINVTTGPGGINTLNGVFGAYVDSIPLLVISGQVRLDTSLSSTTLALRQLGDQECDIIAMVKGITKYAVMIKQADEIKYHLQKALFLAKNGRPGPVWLDIPMNLQGALIEPAKLKSFDPTEEIFSDSIPSCSEETINPVWRKLELAKRPVLMVGAGIRLSGHYDDFLKLIHQLRIPVVTAWNSHDLVPDDHPYYVGRPGTIGNRSGNFAVQNADFLLVLGCRLNIRQISYNYTSFAKHAFIAMVDIDAAELAKPTLSIDMPIHADLAEFIPALLHFTEAYSLPSKNDWLAWCKNRQERYPVVLNEYWKTQNAVHAYCFMERLSEHLSEDQVIVTANGTACVVAFQAMKIKKGQRLYTNSGCASMGYDLPAAIGAAIGLKDQSVICLAGDGSLMQNIQELAIIADKKYPIKIFLLNNNGYHSIRQTQQNFFSEAAQVGVGPESGLGFPNFKKIAEGFGLPYIACHNHDELENAINHTLSSVGPIICEVMIDLSQQFAPKVSSKRLADGTIVTCPLEDMAPFLSKEELDENLIKDYLK